MAQTSAFCRAQESLQRDRAAGAKLENVREVATRAAIAWAREASSAEQREQKRAAETSAEVALSSQEDEEVEADG